MKLRNSDSYDGTQALGSDENGLYKNKKLADGTILSYAVKSVTGGEVNVSLSCTKNKDVSLGLYTLGGVTIGKTSLQDVDMENHVWHQKLHRDKSAVYLLSIIVDGQAFTEKLVNK